ncbi:fimbrial protein [Dyella sp. C9]|uniref:fimbrial protein n=1 Tax=Dyella sp. C9 TaxID=2202154 RepID=UPI0018E52B4D|nr:fimbrial protein [Dyella sp. C9]
MKVQTARRLIGLAVMVVPAFALAAPTVTFQGEVTDQTCQATINGDTNSVVLLPTVSAASLLAAGATAGLTPFTIQVTGCTMGADDLAIGTEFLGHNVTNGGNLGNTGSAKNVDIQLTTSASGGNPVSLNGPTTVPGLVLQAGATSAAYQFGAQYISEAGGGEAGSVQAVAEYTLSYL